MSLRPGRLPGTQSASAALSQVARRTFFCWPRYRVYSYGYPVAACRPKSSWSHLRERGLTPNYVDDLIKEFVPGYRLVKADDPFPLRDIAVPGDFMNPIVDVKEADGKLFVHAELPGVKKDDIRIDLNEGAGYVELSAKKESKTEDREGDKVVRSERRFGEFRRRIPVPEGVKEDDIKAKFDNGVLEVSIDLPKSAPPKIKGAIKID